MVGARGVEFGEYGGVCEEVGRDGAGVGELCGLLCCAVIFVNWVRREVCLLCIG